MRQAASREDHRIRSDGGKNGAARLTLAWRIDSVAGEGGAGLNFFRRRVKSGHAEGDDNGKHGESEVYHGISLGALEVEGVYPTHVARRPAARMGQMV
jgi:hypothetical protein